MVGPWLTVLLGLMCGIPFGLGMGLFEGWGTGIVLAAATFGAASAAGAWFSPWRPDGVPEDPWEARRRAA
jgi:anti-sigma factor RsiW